MSATSELLQQKFKLHPLSRTLIKNCCEQTSKQIIVLQDLKAKLSNNVHLEEAVIIREICKMMKEAEALMKLVIDNDK